MKVEKFLNDFFHDDGVAHLPDREWSPGEKVLNAENLALENELRTETGLGHAPEKGGLNLLVDHLAFKLSVQEDARHLTVTQQHLLLQLNFVAGVA